MASPFSTDRLPPSESPMALETESVPAVLPAELPPESGPSDVNQAAVAMDQEAPPAPSPSKTPTNPWIQLK